MFLIEHSVDEYLTERYYCRKEWMQMQLSKGSKYINPVLWRWPSIMWCRIIMKMHFSVVFTERKQMKIVTSVVRVGRAARSTSVV